VTDAARCWHCSREATPSRLPWVPATVCTTPQCVSAERVYIAKLAAKMRAKYRPQIIRDARLTGDAEPLLAVGGR
jgi:hypothetical protein